MARFPGLEWDEKTGKGRVRKLIRGKSISRRFDASTRQEAEAIYYQVIAQTDVPAPEDTRMRKLGRYRLELGIEKFGRDARARGP